MTQNETPNPEPQGYSGREAHDPAHDVDGLKTSIAVFGTLALIVVTIYLASHLFSLMVKVERKAKIEDVPATEMLQIRGAAESELAGKNPNRGAMTIDAAMKALATK